MLPKRTKVVGVRFEVDELAEIQHQASLNKLDLSTYIRKKMISHVEELRRLGEAKTPCDALYEVKESLYALISEMKLNKKC